MIKHVIIALLLILGFARRISCQPVEKYIAKLDTQQVDGKKIIVGWFTNNTASPFYVKYETVLKLKGNEEKVKKGSTLTLPVTPTLLTKAIFTLDDLEFEHIRLVVTNQENEILAYDKIDAPLPLQKPSVNSQPTDPPTTNKKNTAFNSFDLEIDGLVLDETRSKLARDFYETFYRNWSTLSINTQGQNIVIREMPSRIGIGSRVVIEVNDKSISQINLRPRADITEDLAGQLVNLLEQYLLDPNNHAVIEGDDLTGSGIY